MTVARDTKTGRIVGQIVTTGHVTEQSTCAQGLITVLGRDGWTAVPVHSVRLEEHDDD